MKFWRDFMALVRPYWTGEERGRAWLIGAGMVGLNLFQIYILTVLTYWQGQQGDSFQEKNAAKFLHSVWFWLGWVALWITSYVYSTYLQQLLGLRWRRWMTARFLDTYLSDRTHYFWRFGKEAADNPDQRISEDVGQFIDNTLSLFVNILSSIAVLFSYTGILWRLGGRPPLPLPGGGHFVLPGYLVYAALLWSGLTTLAAHTVGKKLIDLNARQQRREADFRFGLVRVRENSESIALSRGETAESQGLMTRFLAIVANYQQIMTYNKRVNAVAQINLYVGSQISYFVAGPLFFKDVISLGGLNQIASSFGYLQGAMSFVVSSYAQIALWQAIIRRLTEFRRTAEETKSIAATALRPLAASTLVSDSPIAVEKLSLSLPDGTPLARELSLTLGAGESVLVMGPSGSGKSTLIRAISGLWPFAEGKIVPPADFDVSQLLVLPQRPYLPLGTLKTALAYPLDPAELPDTDWSGLLAAVHLEGLRERLDTEENWSQVLSGGEQQRVAFARVFVHKPRYLFLDEATSALDEEMEASLYAEVRRLLPETAILSVGHRSSLLAAHDRQIDFRTGLAKTESENSA